MLIKNNMEVRMQFRPLNSLFRIFCAAAIISILLILSSCSDSAHNSNGMNVEFVPSLKIGKETSDSLCYRLGRIDDIHVDKAMNIYICDGSEQGIYMYDSTGIFIRQINKGRGQGPGECLGAREIKTTKNGDVAILDSKQSKIILFDKNGQYLRDVIIRDINPVTFELLDNSIITTGRFHLYPGGLIHQYDLETGSLLNTFGERNADSLSISRCGNWECLAKNNEYILLSRVYPYQIDCFNLEGKMIRSITSPLENIKPPYPVKTIYGTMFASAFMPKSLCLLPDGKIISVIATFDESFYLKSDAEKPHLWADFFEFNGAHLIRIPLPSKGITNEWIRIVRTDDKGNLYLDCQDPYPHIIKYRSSFES